MRDGFQDLLFEIRDTGLRQLEGQLERQVLGVAYQVRRTVQVMFCSHRLVVLKERTIRMYRTTMYSLGMILQVLGEGGGKKKLALD